MAAFEEGVYWESILPCLINESSNAKHSMGVYWGYSWLVVFTCILASVSYRDMMSKETWILSQYHLFWVLSAYSLYMSMPNDILDSVLNALRWFTHNSLTVLIIKSQSLVTGPFGGRYLVRRICWHFSRTGWKDWGCEFSSGLEGAKSACIISRKG